MARFVESPLQTFSRATHNGLRFPGHEPTRIVASGVFHYGLEQGFSPSKTTAELAAALSVRSECESVTDCPTTPQDIVDNWGAEGLCW